jgi:hypothetical protein
MNDVEERPLTTFTFEYTKANKKKLEFQWQYPQALPPRVERLQRELAHDIRRKLKGVTSRASGTVTQVRPAKYGRWRIEIQRWPGHGHEGDLIPFVFPFQATM